jgi:hypothetical protein
VIQKNSWQKRTKKYALNTTKNSRQEKQQQTTPTKEPLIKKMKQNQT